MLSSDHQSHQSSYTALVDTLNAGQRLDNFLMARLRDVPRSLVYRIIRSGEVRVNKGRSKPDYRIQTGDAIRVPPLLRQPIKEALAPPQNVLHLLESTIIYEDDGLMVVNKPSGIAVHGGSGISWGVIESFRSLRPNDTQLELVHRLDRDTSGLLMIAKRRSRLRALHEALRQGRIYKEYMALLEGEMKVPKQKISVPLLKNHLKSGERMVIVDPNGRASETIFELEKKLHGASLVRAYPITGRTHQIRVHAQYLNQPIGGDAKYGSESFNSLLRKRGCKRLLLHAHQIKIKVEGEKPLVLCAPLDQEWLKLLDHWGGHV